MKKRIALLGLWDISNYGDPILGFCTESLLRKYLLNLNNTEIVEISLHFVVKKTLSQRLKDSIIYRTFKLMNSSEYAERKIYEKYLQEYFSQSLKNIDYIIFVGGGIIKYKIEYFDYAIESIVKIAQMNHIPIMMNAVGIEGYDSNNIRCMKLKDSLKDSSIKYFSTRDDINRLINGYFDGNPTIPCELVADPAVWTSECFNIQRNSESNIIGIGIARGGIFKDYGFDFSQDKMIDFYVGIAKIVLNKGCKVELFTNGLNCDNFILEKVMEKLNNFNVTKRIPNSARNLVEIIASYKAIVTTRLHAGIIAYSMDIPAIGLIWNDKVRLFWKNAGNPQNSIEIKDIAPDKVYAVLERAIKNGYNQEIKQKFRQTIKDSLMRIAKMID